MLKQILCYGFYFLMFSDWEKQRDQLMASLRGREDFEAINTKEYFRWWWWRWWCLWRWWILQSQITFQGWIRCTIQVLEQKEWGVCGEKWLIQLFLVKSGWFYVFQIVFILSIFLQHFVSILSSVHNISLKIAECILHSFEQGVQRTFWTLKVKNPACQVSHESMMLKQKFAIRQCFLSHTNNPDMRCLVQVFLQWFKKSVIRTACYAASVIDLTSDRDTAQVLLVEH